MPGAVDPSAVGSRPAPGPSPRLARFQRAECGLFLDRDGTLIVERDDPVTSPVQIELLPDAARAVARFNHAGWPVVLVTNQAAIARGQMALDQYERVRVALAAALDAHGATLDLDLCCPHHEREGLPPYRRACECRKPRGGLLRRAQRAFGQRPARWLLIGDAWRDLEAARSVGATGHLVLTGKGARERERCLAAGLSAQHVHANLWQAAQALLQGK